MSQEDTHYRAMLARDYRFDGKFFVGVKTTGIYCRPICPAKPKRENVEFFASARLAYYRSHRMAGLESFESGTYERVFRLDGSIGLARVRTGLHPASLSLQVIGGDIRSLSRLVRTVRRMFDLDSDPLLVANAFAGDPHLRKLLRKNPGLRSPRGWNAYEIAICSILGQLVSIEQANRMIAQLIDGYGEEIRHPLTGAPLRLFPGPAALAGSNLEKVGTTQARKATLREFSRQLSEGKLSLGSTQDPLAFRRSLLDIKGIGPWTAEYISLRSIADTDAFPAIDLVLKRALEENPGIDLEAVKPWRGYAAAHLWQAHSQDRGKKGKPR